MNMPNTNRLAKLLHPVKQEMIIRKVICENEKMKTFVLESAKGEELAFFNAGDYIPVYVNIDGNEIERPYSISSCPKDSENGFYTITVKKADGGYISTWIHENWTEGMKVYLGSPMAGANHSPIRDRSKIIAIAGGSGATTMHSMAKAVAVKDVDYEMTFFYCVNNMAEIAYKDEWDELVKASSGKLSCVFVVANEEVPGCEHGFISLDIIKKYASIEDSSIFVSGPSAMAEAIKAFLKPLNIERRYLRINMSGDSGVGQESAESCTIIVHRDGETKSIVALKSETILRALEKAGLQPAACCRSGKCGQCRALVISGKAVSVTEEDGVRRADRKYGYIHTCSSCPTSDMEIIMTKAK